MNFIERTLGNTYGVIVHPEDERSDGVDVMPCETVKNSRVLAGFTKVLVYVGHIRGIDRLHADKNPLTTGFGDEINEFFVAQQVCADLGYPRQLGAGGDDVPQQRLRAFGIDGQIVVDEENCDLTALFARARLEPQEFVNNTLVVAKANRVAEKSSHSAKLTAVRTATPRLYRNNVKCSPTASQPRHKRSEHVRHKTELIKVQCLPWN